MMLQSLYLNTSSHSRTLGKEMFKSVNDITEQVNDATDVTGHLVSSVHSTDEC